jgi:hypothetical protein
MKSTNEILAEVTAKKEWSTPVLTSLSVSLETFSNSAKGTDGGGSSS